VVVSPEFRLRKHGEICPIDLTPRCDLDIVRRFRVNREPAAVQFARRRPVWGSMRYTGFSSSPQGLCRVAGMGRVSCGETSSQSYLRHPPPGRSQFWAGVQGWAMRGGTAKRSQLQLPVVLVCGLYVGKPARGSKGRSATVDCCSSEFECSRREARDNLRARHVSVLTYLCV
jgi:hypothetical protein